MKVEVNKLYFENCVEVLKRLPDNSIDAYIQDPPFEVTANEWDKGFIDNLPILWELWIQKGKKNTPFIFKATFPFVIDLINSNRKMFKYEWIWKKNKYTNFVNAKKMPMRCFEYIFIFYKEQPTYNPVLRKNITTGAIRGNNFNSTKIYNIRETENSKNYVKKTDEYGQPTNFLDIRFEKEAFNTSKTSQDRHPNRTNPELWKYFIKTYTNEGDLIFDGYSGSGSVPQAAIELNRNWIACENSKEYFFETEKRLLNTKEIKEHGYAKTELTSNKNSLFFSLAI
jgi:site-specific DNA-methyltransferase (adenine-specific)